MTINISAELKQTFELASLRLMGKRLRTGDQWREVQDISERFAKARATADTTYRAEYETRIEVARKRLIDAAAAKDKDFTFPWARRDRFGNDAIRRQAVREVRGSHANDLALIDGAEVQALEKVLQRADDNTRLRDKVRDDFSRSTDRRDHADRRRTDTQSRRIER